MGVPGADGASPKLADAKIAIVGAGKQTMSSLLIEKPRN